MGNMRWQNPKNKYTADGLTPKCAHCQQPAPMRYRLKCDLCGAYVCKVMHTPNGPVKRGCFDGHYINAHYLRKETP